MCVCVSVCLCLFAHEVRFDVCNECIFGVGLYLDVILALRIPSTLARQIASMRIKNSTVIVECKPLFKRLIIVFLNDGEHKFYD